MIPVLGFVVSGMVSTRCRLVTPDSGSDLGERKTLLVTEHTDNSALRRGKGSKRATHRNVVRVWWSRSAVVVVVTRRSFVDLARELPDQSRSLTCGCDFSTNSGRFHLDLFAGRKYIERGTNLPFRPKRSAPSFRRYCPKRQFGIILERHCSFYSITLKLP